MGNAKINGYSFNGRFVSGLKSFEVFVRAYSTSAYTEHPNQMELLKAAWEFYHPPVKETQKETVKDKPKTEKKATEAKQ